MVLKFLALFVLYSFALTLTDSAGVHLFYPFGLGLDQSLDLGDDVASEKFILDIPVVFYSQRKNEVWVSKLLLLFVLSFILISLYCY